MAINSLLFHVVIAPANNLATGIADFRLPIAGCPAVAGWWPLEGLATSLFQLSIGRQPAAAGQRKVGLRVAAKGGAVQLSRGA